MLADKLIAPVFALMDKPVVELKVPPVVNPATVVGVGFAALIQTGVVYENPVTGVAIGLMTMLAVLFAAGLHPDAATL